LRKKERKKGGDGDDDEMMKEEKRVKERTVNLMTGARGSFKSYNAFRLR